MSVTRIVVLVLVVTFGAGAALTAAGMVRRGPLSFIGWRDATFTADKVLVPQRAAEPVLQVAVPWRSARYCPEELTVQIVETPVTVVVGPVYQRHPRFGVTQSCEGAAAVAGVAYLAVPLHAPVGSRRVVKPDGEELPVVGR